MNWLDISLLCLTGIGLIKGLSDGMVKQVVSLIALFAAIFFCTKVADWLCKYITNWGWFSGEWTTIASYIAAFILILGVVVLAGEIVNRAVNFTPLSFLNHLVGGLVGGVLMLFFVSLFFNLLEITDTRSKLISPETKIESRFYYQIKEILPTIYPRGLFNSED